MTKIIIEGIAKESKSGLEVNGIVLEGLSYDLVEKYDGKYIKIKGILHKEFKPNITDQIVTKFEGPYMTDIEILE